MSLNESAIFVHSFRDDVKSCILEWFAGPSETGILSPSVQNTLFLTAKAALARIPQVRHH